MAKTLLALLDEQRQFFLTQATLPYDFRMAQLNKLESMITKNTDAILNALHRDLKKPKVEAFVSEIGFLLTEIRHLKEHLRGWMKPESVKTPIHLKPAKSYIYREPLGAVLILTPWNYPFQLAIAPLMSALAAGNCAMLKPSELAPHTSSLIKKLISETFSENLVAVVEGGIQETTELLELKFDHIFFTGSTPVGRVVMRAAAEHLTPVTLELGGKSPAVVAQSADLDLAARRITWGKFMNAGQTCVAPDYALVHESLAQEFAKKIAGNIKAFYGENPQQSESYARIINTKHFDRLKRMMGTSQIDCGGDFDEQDLYIGPTVVTGVAWTDPIMQEEIFGPLLPIITYAHLDEAFAAINHREKPLAAYLFSEDEKEISRFLKTVPFGGGAINDVTLHLSNPDLPFGGIGASGMGAYHGKKGFETFSHQKSLLKKSRFLDFGLRYPPYQGKHFKLMRSLFKA